MCCHGATVRMLYCLFLFLQHQARSECLTCTFRACCCSARLSRAPESVAGGGCSTAFFPLSFIYFLFSFVCFCYLDLLFSPPASLGWEGGGGGGLMCGPFRGRSGQSVKRAHSEQAVVAHACHGHRYHPI